MDAPENKQTKPWLFALLLLLLGIGAYWGSLPAPFLFDDIQMIVQPLPERGLWEAGELVTRPVLNFSLALDYELFGMDARAFRATNIAIHIAAALVLFGLVRRTLRMRYFAKYELAHPDFAAFAVAGLWMLHPLQTMAVTYIWQRGESMMALFFLATLYCIVRAAEGTWSKGWSLGALLFCALGLGTKEVMVAVFPVVLIFDGVLLSGSFREALRRRLLFYGAAALGSVYLVIYASSWMDSSFGKVASLDYAASQPGVILDYLRLAIWPSPLCFDYMRLPAQGVAAIVIPGLIIATLVCGTAWLLWKRSWLGVAGAWFFLVLAPTSSVVPINDLMVEYRMYLPLAAISALIVGAGVTTGKFISIPRELPLAAALALLGLATHDRNKDYLRAEKLWQATLDVAPDNYRAYDKLGCLYLAEGRLPQAAHNFEKSLAIDTTTSGTHWNMGQVLQRQGKLEEAYPHYANSLKIRPTWLEGTCHVGALLCELKRYEVARTYYQTAVDQDPKTEVAQEGMLFTLLNLPADKDETLAACRSAKENFPDAPRIQAMLGTLFMNVDEGDKARKAFRRAIELDPTRVDIRQHLASALFSQERFPQARKVLREALARPELAADPERKKEIELDLDGLRGR